MQQKAGEEPGNEAMPYVCVRDIQEVVMCSTFVLHDLRTYVRTYSSSDPVLFTRDAVVQGCWCVRAMLYVRLMQTDTEREARASKTSEERTVVGHTNAIAMREPRDQTSIQRTLLGEGFGEVRVRARCLHREQPDSRGKASYL